jgi:hypothetical protein
LLDGLVLELLALRDDLRGACLSIGQHLRDARLGLGEALAGFLAGGEPVRDLLLPVLDRAHQRRPDELGTEADEDGERNRLHQQRQVDIHDCPRWRLLRGRYFNPAGISGLPNAKSIASRLRDERRVVRPAAGTLSLSAGSFCWRAAPSSASSAPTPARAQCAGPMMDRCRCRSGLISRSVAACPFRFPFSAGELLS